MNNQNIRWNWVKDTDHGYIITSTGKVFSRVKADYIKPQINETGVIFYRLKFSDGKTRVVSLNTLLKEAFE